MKLPIKYKEAHWSTRKEAREQYVIQQEGKCYFCGSTLDKNAPPTIANKYGIDWKLFPANFLKYPVHLHHCHKTGYTLGAVHARCNAVLWQYFGE